jgi:glutaredoxin
VRLRIHAPAQHPARGLIVTASIITVEDNTQSDQRFVEISRMPHTCSNPQPKTEQRLNTMTTHTIAILKTPGCGACIATATTFDKRLKGTDIVIDKIDMSTDEAALDLAKNTLGYSAAPVIVVRDAAGTIVDHWNGINMIKIGFWSEQLISEKAVEADIAA